MKTRVTRWLPAITKTSTRKTALAAAGFAAVCGGIAGPAAAAQGAPASTTTTDGVTLAAMSKPASGAHNPANDKHDNGQHNNDKHNNDKHGNGQHGNANPAPPPPAAKQLAYQYQGQINFYYCGPAATRIAASAHGHTPSQDAVAQQLGTTINGTNSAVDTTRVLNSIDGTKAYHTTAIPGKTATPAQAAQFQSDVVRAVNEGNPVVANIAGTASDTLGGTHSYNGGHYLTVVGYRDNGKSVLIADPADTQGDGSYWMNLPVMANWMATHGYSS